MPINRLRALSGISVEISYDIDVDADISRTGTHSWKVRDLSFLFLCPKDILVRDIEGILVNNFYYDMHVVHQEVHGISAVPMPDPAGRYLCFRATPDIMPMAAVYANYPTIARPQLAFVAGDSWQVDPIQGDDWRNHNFNFAWLGAPQS